MAERESSAAKGTADGRLLHGRMYADFRDATAYFITAFDLILSVYNIPRSDPAVADLRESLLGREAM